MTLVIKVFESRYVKYVCGFIIVKFVRMVASDVWAEPPLVACMLFSVSGWYLVTSNFRSYFVCCKVVHIPVLHVTVNIDRATSFSFM